MEDKTKKMIFTIGSLFVAIIFVTSYAAFGNTTNAPSTTTSTAGPTNTILATGQANGIIENYSYIVNITVANASQNAKLNLTLSNLESNNTVISFFARNSTTYTAELSGIGAYSFYTYLTNTLNYSNVSVGGTALVRLPATVNMQYGTINPQQAPISLAPKNYSVLLPNLLPIGTTITLKIQALVTETGHVAGNNLKLTRISG